MRAMPEEMSLWPGYAGAFKAKPGRLQSVLSILFFQTIGQLELKAIKAHKVNSVHANKVGIFGNAAENALS